MQTYEIQRQFPLEPLYSGWLQVAIVALAALLIFRERLWQWWQGRKN